MNKQFIVVEIIDNNKINRTLSRVVLKTTLLKVRFTLLLCVNVKDYIVQHA